MRQRGPKQRGRARPAGVSTGTLAFVAAWIVGAAIARLTGAAAVLLLLAAGIVALAAAAISALLAIRRLRVDSIAIPNLTTVGLQAPLAVTMHTTAARMEHHDGVVRVFTNSARQELLTTIQFAEFTDFENGCAVAQASVTFDHAGTFDEVHVEIATSGAAGLMWFKRPTTVQVETVHVTPIPVGPSLPVTTTPTTSEGESTSPRGPRNGDIDGVRPWREGDGEGAVHWPSTLRSGSVIVHDRSAANDRAWTIDAPAPGDAAAAQLHFTMLEGLRQGHTVSVDLSPGADESTIVPVRSPTEAQLLAARYVGRQTWNSPSRLSLLKRQVLLHTKLETETRVFATSRWLTALAMLLAFAMLLGALDSGPMPKLAAALGLSLGAATSVHFGARSDKSPVGLRVAVAVATVGALAHIASGVGGVSGLLAALRGPMPELLMLLAGLHGFEITDRRTLRVHQATSAVVLAYATGLRIDDRVGWWLAAWGVTMVLAVRATTSTPQSPRSANTFGRQVGRGGRYTRHARRIAVLAVLAGAATLGLLSVVPVPDGPARLGLPALANNPPSAATPGSLAGPDGGAPPATDGTRGSLGQVGGYPGFSESLDTSVRGDLGNEIVMRVRAPQPAFWRGQTFSNFDGRTWTISPEQGSARRGPRIEIEPTLGEGAIRGSGVDTKEFVQTYYIEADLPNVVFAASRAASLTFDGTIWARPDGALRSNVTLTEGSVYTVVSERAQITPQILRDQGDISEFFSALDTAQSEEWLQPFLEVPASTTERTIKLAASLRTPGESTYDTILAYQVWLSQNTVYDLNAPVPGRDADAVDDYLFESQRGFCEQIASSLAIMLRSQGIPTRIATGYIPGVRDRVSGVFEVRASDAHAWVEVWFPQTGWESFDPTASVPLAGDAEQGSVGADLVTAAIAGVVSRPVELGLLAGAVSALIGLIKMVATLLHRRRRGRWGILQDRFHALASTSQIATNPSIAESIHDGQRQAKDVAATLDRVAFDPSWTEDDDAYEYTRSQLDQLEKV